MAINIKRAFYKLGDFFGGSEKAFYNSYKLFDGKGEVYVNTEYPRKLYYEITELNQVVDKFSTMFSNGKFKLVDAQTEEEIEDKALMALLEKPNPFQSQNELLKNYSEQFNIYGNQFQYTPKPSPLMEYPRAIINISPCYTTPILTGKYYDQTDIEGIVKHYKVEEDNKTRVFDTKDILWTKNPDIDDPIKGISPLVSLKYPLSNTKLANEYYNAISSKKGAIGLIATTQKDSAGALPMSPEDKLDIERKFSKDYGVHEEAKSAIGVVDGSVTWQPMSYPTKDLQLKEQKDDNKFLIIDHWGLDANIFSGKNSTYENVKNGMKLSYNNAIIPFAQSYSQALSIQLGLDPEEKKLILDYSHIAILQEDKKDKAETIKSQIASVKEAKDMGLLDAAMATTLLNELYSLDLPTPPTPAAPTE